MSITENYSYGYGDVFSTTTDVVGGILGGLLIFFAIFAIIGIGISVLMVISMWKIFNKNGKPGWYSLIPFLNTWTLFEMTGNKGWLSLIPFVNIIFMYIANFKLAKKMGRGTGFAIFLLFVPVIGYPILAFSKKSVVVNNDVNMNNNVNVNNTLTMNNNINNVNTNNSSMMNNNMTNDVSSITNLNQNNAMTFDNVYANNNQVNIQESNNSNNNI